MKGLAEHQKANELWQRGKRTIALKKHAKACQLNPTHPIFAQHYAFALSQSHHPHDAEKIMARALDLGWSNLATTIDTCVVARGEKFYDLLHDFLKDKERPAPIEYFYADSLERRGNRSTALQIIENIPEQERFDYPFLQLLYSQLLARNLQAEQAKEAIHKITSAQLPLPLQPEFHYTLASIYDKLEAQEEAFSSLKDAKNILKKNAPAKNHLSQYSRDFNKAVLPLTHKSTSPEKSTQVVLCGHPRSGTTLIEQILDSHPSISSVEEQDCFFTEVCAPLHAQYNTITKISHHLSTVPQHYLEQLRDSYLNALHQYLPDSQSADLTIDKFPDLSTTLGLYRKLIPNSKFIVVLRDPRDVVLSCYFQNLPINAASSPYLNLDTTVDKYITTIQCWLDSKAHFHDGWIETRYEDWIGDAKHEAKRLCTFLDITWDERTLNFHERRKTVHSPTFSDVNKPIYTDSLFKWKKYKKQLAPVLEKLNPICEILDYPTI